MTYANSMSERGVGESRSRRVILQQLREQVATARLLYGSYWGYWNSFGPVLQGLSLPFNRYASEVLVMANALVDRIHTIDPDPSSTEAIHACAPSFWSASRHTSICAALDEADVRTEAVITGLLRAARLAAEEQDSLTEELLLRAAAVNGKHERCIREVRFGLRC